MKKIILNRTKRDENSCRGNIVIYEDDIQLLSLQTLENEKRKIPKGRYTLTYTYSNKFKRHLWLISGVRNRYGIRIHPANTYKQLTGCIALGMYADIDMNIYKSRDACDLFTKLLDTRIIYQINIIEL